jgi:hypothetical protein
MALGYATVKIESIELKDAAGDPCKVRIEGGSDPLFDFGGSLQYSADSSVFLEYIDTGVRGSKITLLIDALPPAKLGDLKTAIRAKIVAGLPIHVEAEDDIHDFDFTCFPNYEDHGRKWILYPAQDRTDEEFITQMQMHLVVEGVAA